MDKTIIVTKILIIFVFTTSICYAETLHGRVYDTRQGTLGSHMLVVLNTSPARTTYTDKGGFYYFKNVEPGAYLVRLYKNNKLDNYIKKQSEKMNSSIWNLANFVAATSRPKQSNYYSNLSPTHAHYIDKHSANIPIVARLVVSKGRTTLHNFNLSNIGHPHADDDY